MEAGVVVAFDDRDELDVSHAEVVAEEAVDVERVVLVRRVHRAEDVDVDFVLAEQLVSAQHLVEGRVALLVDAERVVQLARTVDADADEEACSREQLAPLVGQQRAVGLDRVFDGLVRAPMLLDELDRAAEEVDAHQRRLAALPGDGDLGRRAATR